MNRPLWRPAYVGVGSNLDNPEEQARAGIKRLAELSDTLLVLQSALYRTAPMGPQDQPDFVNAVVAVVTRLDPAKLLSKLQAIELAQGRDRSAKKWGPRTLDLDLLSFSTVKMDTAALTLPHPGIAERNFVLLPWHEIAPHYRVPGLATVRRLVESFSGNESAIEKLN